MMSLISLIPRGLLLPAAVAVVIALVGGALGAALLAMINTAIHGSSLPRTALILTFVALVVGKTLCGVVSRVLLNHFTQRMLAELCRALSRKVLAAPLGHLERVGIPQIMAALTDDVATIGGAAQNVPNITIKTAMLATCAIYLAWLSWPLLLVVASAMMAGAIVYRILIGRAYRYYEQARNMRDLLFWRFRALTEGMKELKLHAGRREAFLSEQIGTTTTALERDTLAAARHHTIADAWNTLVFYAILGGIIASASTVRGLNAETLTGYVMAALYLMGPAMELMGNWATFAQARIALARVREVDLSLNWHDNLSVDSADMRPVRVWERLDLDGVTFSYPPDIGGQAFVLGPIDFTLRRNELVFVVGGNGSGKSTLVKVLTGLYSPQAGVIRLDGQAVTDLNRSWYSRHFSAVFSDFFLFDRLLGLHGSDLDARAQRYLATLELDTKVQIVNGVFSTTALSQGQRRRLALLTAFLEDRPIYLFDEWTADQDPHYRKIFYERLLPELKARGKTVVVVTHDDRYYHLADRVVKLEYGTLTPGDTLLQSAPGQYLVSGQVG